MSTDRAETPRICPTCHVYEARPSTFGCRDPWHDAAPAAPTPQEHHKPCGSPTCVACSVKHVPPPQEPEPHEKWNPICGVHGVYDIREMRCPKCPQPTAPTPTPAKEPPHCKHCGRHIYLDQETFRLDGVLGAWRHRGSNHRECLHSYSVAEPPDAAPSGAEEATPATSSNYVCNDEVYPTKVTFADGRVVTIANDGLASYLQISPKAEYPKPCGICDGVIQSKDDLDWHGYGNCRDIPETIMQHMSEPGNFEKALILLRRCVGHIAGELGDQIEEFVNAAGAALPVPEPPSAKKLLSVICREIGQGETIAPGLRARIGKRIEEWIAEAVPEPRPETPRTVLLPKCVACMAPNYGYVHTCDPPAGELKDRGEQ